MSETKSELKSYAVWDRPTRLFHWINALSVAALVIVGYLILKGRTLEIPRSGSLVLKIIHTWAGYVFAVNLLVRILWGFFGNRFARWRSVLPWGRGYLSALASYVRAFFSREPEHYLGHNPLGRIVMTAIFVALLVLAVSGLVLAGTDLFYPPLGQWFAQSVAAPGVDPATLVPNKPELYDKAAFDSMRAMRKPFIVSHVYAYYALLALVGLHLLGVIIAELREGGNVVSATLHGKRILPGRPVDEEQVGAG